MATPLINPLAGNLDEETRRMVMARALMSGGLNTLSAAGQGQPFAQALGTGGLAGFNTYDGLINAGLNAQMQKLQRQNIESQIAARQGDQKIANERMKLLRDQLGEKQQQIQGRNESANVIQGMMGGDATQKELAASILAHQLRYGGGMSPNAQNVLMPGGIRQSPLDAMMAAMMGGPMMGGPMMGGYPDPEGTADTAQPPQMSGGTTSDQWLESTLGVNGGETELRKMGAADSLALMKKLEQGVKGMSGPEQQQAARVYSILESNITDAYRRNLIGTIQR